MSRWMMVCVASVMATCKTPVLPEVPEPPAGSEGRSDDDDSTTTECVQDYDCCEDRRVACGQQCHDGSCAPAPDTSHGTEACPAGNEVCDGCDNDGDGDADEGCPPTEMNEDEDEDTEGADEGGAPPSEVDGDAGAPPTGDAVDDPEMDPGLGDPAGDDDADAEIADGSDEPDAPLDDLSNAASWKTDDLIADVPDWTPARVRTVLDGFFVTDLPAFLVGFVSNPLTADSRDLYLLLQTDPADPRWDLVLGPVAGMSGSPIIIEGRNAGALSFSIGDDLGPYLFVATPIEKMLDVEAQELDVALTGDASPLGDPLTAVLAIPPGAGAWFEGAEWTDDRYIEVSDDFVGATAEGGDAPPLTPGSSIAVLVISGDVLNIGGIGTVTAVDGDAIWAFGHPMTGQGDIAFPFRAASIEAIAASAAWGSSYKIGAPAGPLLGAITNDRTAAIAGRHGLAAPTVAVFTHGTYAGATEHLYHETARLTNDPRFSASQALFAAVWPLTIQRDMLFSGAGSIAYEVQVYVAETDAYASHRDILSSARWPDAELFFTLFDATAQLIGNDHLPLTLTSVILTADVSDDRREFEIGDLTHADSIAPGDDLVVAVELLPFGSTEPETRALVLAIPEDFPSGLAQLEVGSEKFLGGDSMPWDHRVDPACEDAETTETPEDLIAKFNAMPRQRVLVGQLKSQTFLSDCPPCDGSKDECVPCEPKEFDPCAPPVQPPSVRVSSEEDGVILGLRSVTIEITGAESEEPLPEEPKPPDCPPEGCSEKPTEPSVGDGGGGGGGEEPPPPPTTDPTEVPCPAGDEICDGCDNDGDGEEDEGCPPPSAD